MKENQEARRVFIPWFALFISLACIACLVHVQWTLYTHREQIGFLMKQNEELRDLKQQLLEQNKQTKVTFPFSVICGAINFELLSLTGFLISTILSLPGNEKYLKALSRLLSPVLKNPSTSRWVRCWHAATDGWDVTKTFHPQCDGKGPAVTIVRVGSYVFGGYTEMSWHSNGHYFSSTKSFLFSLFNVKGFNPIKLPLTGNNNKYAVYWGKGYGPTFGNGHDLYISNHASSNTGSYTTLITYKLPPGCSYNKKCIFFTGSSSFTPSDIEVFYEIS
ncbi:uncharacterized protein LOC116295410 [Actinia tenebrosa]|uniref:Uncharacterized protein LOC116295410 n=1 Tax=Actinia tenebrosa TaxID=6105 RepID=A0A6P8I2I6_ACTTE|nr:uncharacterized protein LOC116295410 [Actinia tenebrosa]